MKERKECFNCSFQNKCARYYVEYGSVYCKEHRQKKKGK